MVQLNIEEHQVRETSASGKTGRIGNWTEVVILCTTWTNSEGFTLAITNSLGTFHLPATWEEWEGIMTCLQQHLKPCVGVDYAAGEDPT